MDQQTDTPLDRLEEALAPSGLFVRGGFHPAREDDVPGLPDGRAARTIVLAGNAGGEMWRRFRSDRPGNDAVLDRWLKPRILRAATAADAHAIFPNQGPPFIPIQEWAQRCEAVHRSPLGILIHPEFGLWHIYRAAFLFPDRLELPGWSRLASPCESCEKKPCLQVCPADAFTPDRFVAQNCATHLASDDGRPCLTRGCMARRACPVGRDYVYPRDAQAFHMEAFVTAVARGYGRSD